LDLLFVYSVDEIVAGTPKVDDLMPGPNIVNPFNNVLFPLISEFIKSVVRFAKSPVSVVLIVIPELVAACMIKSVAETYFNFNTSTSFHSVG
jgi:hypothetical protein